MKINDSICTHIEKYVPLLMLAFNDTGEWTLVIMEMPNSFVMKSYFPYYSNANINGKIMILSGAFGRHRLPKQHELKVNKGAVNLLS